MSNNSIKDILTKTGKLITPDNIQKYVLGTKKNGNPRVLYDIYIDHKKPKKKKKKKKKKSQKYIDPFMVLPLKKKKKK